MSSLYHNDHNKKILFFTGLIAVAILFSIYNLYLTGYPYFEATTRKTRHMIRFGTILLAWGIGVFAYKRGSPGWLLPLWHILYVTICLILLPVGIYDWYSGGAGTGLRSLAMSMNEFLISPVPFVIAGLVRRLAAEQGPVRLEKFR